MIDKIEPEPFEVVTVQGGIRSLRSREHGETFHPVVGPMAEAVGLHVRQQRLAERAAATEGKFVVWDVGLGAAANAIAAIEALTARGQEGKPVEIHSFDRTVAPLSFALAHAEELDYVVPHAGAIRSLLADHATSILNVRWVWHGGDFRQAMQTAPSPHAVLYDPYSPQSNPEMWTLEHFAQLRAKLSAEVPCLLTNYTRSTAVRVTLLLAGFFVGRGHATGEKDQTTIASNALELVEEPLDAAWLARVSRSTNGAPLRTGELRPARIVGEDWERLAGHPQFAALARGVD